MGKSRKPLSKKNSKIFFSPDYSPRNLVVIKAKLKMRMKRTFVR